MKEEIEIQIAAICVSLRVDSAQCADYIKDNYKKFVSSKEPVFYLDVYIAEKALPRESSKIGLTVLNSEIIISDEYFSAKIDIINGKGNTVISSDSARISIATLLRNIFTILLLKKYNGVALHAAGILHNGKVYIFTGPSKNGKTTVSKLSLAEGRTVLSDDLIFIRQLNGGHFVFPTPSWLHMQEGDMENKPYPIGGIFRLKKDDKIYLENLSRGTAMAEILTVLNIPYKILPVQWLLDRFYDIIKQYPFYRLHFKKDESFWGSISAVT